MYCCVFWWWFVCVFCCLVFGFVLLGCLGFWLGWIGSCFLFCLYLVLDWVFLGLCLWWRNLWLFWFCWFCCGLVEYLVLGGFVRVYCFFSWWRFCGLGLVFFGVVWCCFLGYCWWFYLYIGVVFVLDGWGECWFWCCWFGNLVDFCWRLVCGFWNFWWIFCWLFCLRWVSWVGRLVCCCGFWSRGLWCGFWLLCCGLVSFVIGSSFVWYGYCGLLFLISLLGFCLFLVIGLVGIWWWSVCCCCWGWFVGLCSF